MKIIAYVLYGLWILSLWAWAAYMLKREYGQSVLMAILMSMCYVSAEVVMEVWV